MTHKFKQVKQGMYVWRCAFCGKGFGDIFSRDQHEIQCVDRKGARHTSQGRRVGTAY